MSITAQQIPAGWEISTLGLIADVKNGKTNSQDAQEYGDYPLFDRSSDIKRSDKYLFDSEAIIIPGEGAEFIPKYFSGKFDLHQRAYATYNFREGIVPRFVYYNIDHFKKYFEKVSVGSTVKSLRLPHLIEYPILLPPFAEQTKITAILSKVDEEIEKVERIIGKTEKLKKGLMQKLLTKGIGHTKFKQTELGEIPEEWEVMKFGKVAKIANGQVDPKKDPYRQMILIAPNHIKPDSGTIFEKESAEAQGAISGKYFVDKGDIIYSKIRPYLKKVALADEQCLCSADMYPIKGTDKLNSVFMFYILLTDHFTDFANSNSARTGIPKINREELNSYQFALPPISEQKKIGEVLTTIDRNILFNKQFKSNLMLLKKGLMNDLLSGKVRTKI